MAHAKIRKDIRGKLTKNLLSLQANLEKQMRDFLKTYPQIEGHVGMTVFLGTRGRARLNKTGCQLVFWYKYNPKLHEGREHTACNPQPGVPPGGYLVELTTKEVTDLAYAVAFFQEPTIEILFEGSLNGMMTYNVRPKLF